MRNVKCVEDLTHNIQVFYFATILKAVAITMPHAVLTLVFLSKGITYAQIASIQAVYSIAMIIFEFPSGVLADKYSKKTIFILSNLIMMCSYIIVLMYNSFYLLAVAWFMYGISNAFETGTIDAHIVISIKKINDADEMRSKLEKFIGTGSSLTGIASIAGAAIGFFLYQRIYVNIYYAMLLLMVLSALLVWFQYRYTKLQYNREDISLLSLVRNTMAELRHSKDLRWIMVSFGVLQVYIQIHFQMWQSFFLEAGYSEHSFLGMYLLFQAITIVVYKMPVLKLFRNYMSVFAILGVLSVVAMYFARNKLIIVIFYCIPVVIVFMFQYFLNIAYNAKVKEENISALISLTSTITRCFGACTLLIASVIIKNYTIKTLYLVCPAVAITVVALISKKIVKSVFHDVKEV